MTHQHILLVAGSRPLRLCLRLNHPSDQHHLAKAALLHDVGKTRIPAAILNKPGASTRRIAVMHTTRHRPCDARKFRFDAATLAVVRSHH